MAVGFAVRRALVPTHSFARRSLTFPGQARSAVSSGLQSVRRYHPGWRLSSAFQSGNLRVSAGQNLGQGATCAHSTRLRPMAKIKTIRHNNLCPTSHEHKGHHSPRLSTHAPPATVITASRRQIGQENASDVGNFFVPASKAPPEFPPTVSAPFCG